MDKLIALLDLMAQELKEDNDRAEMEALARQVEVEEVEIEVIEIKGVRP